MQKQIQKMFSTFNCFICNIHLIWTENYMFALKVIIWIKGEIEYARGLDIIEMGEKIHLSYHLQTAKSEKKNKEKEEENLSRMKSHAKIWKK